MTETGHDLYSTNEVAQMAGVTYRQLDYWLRVGWLNIDTEAHGSGSRRKFTRTEALALVAIVERYVKAKSEIEAIRSGEAWEQATGEVVR